MRSYSLSFSPLIHSVLDYYRSRDDCMRFSNIYNHFSQNRSFSNSIEVWQIVQRLERRRLLYSALPVLCTVPILTLGNAVLSAMQESNLMELFPVAHPQDLALRHFIAASVPAVLAHGTSVLIGALWLDRSGFTLLLPARSRSRSRKRHL